MSGSDSIRAKVQNSGGGELENCCFQKTAIDSKFTIATGIWEPIFSQSEGQIMPNRKGFIFENKNLFSLFFTTNPLALLGEGEQIFPKQTVSISSGLVQYYVCSLSQLTANAHLREWK